MDKWFVLLIWMRLNHQVLRLQLKKNRKKPARAKGEIFWLVFEIALPIILSLIIYGLTGHIMFTAFVGVLAALPVLGRGMSLPLESEGGKSKDSDTGGSK